jgi:hypothetical protein
MFRSEGGAPLSTSCPDESELPFGALVGIVELVDIRPAFECPPDPFVEGALRRIPENPSALELVSYRGVLGIFDVSDELVASSIA